jgi:hypothetical protein
MRGLILGLCQQVSLRSMISFGSREEQLIRGTPKKTFAFHNGKFVAHSGIFTLIGKL